MTLSTVSCSRDHPLPRGPEDLAPTPPVGSVPFPNRLNPGNDGTSYEPCSVSANEVISLGWSPTSKRDAATVDKQTARGCIWHDAQLGSVWSVSQIVGNSPSLDAYRTSHPHFTWLPDVTINGRTIGVHLMGPSTCATSVQSQRAGVSTIVSYNRVPAPPTSQICDRAIAFTRATISQMPI
ncbi:DUF3558 domain-containing protein [Gordonia sp. X0973]|nr:DUF3558 domain-containing protein [Gordonia sp. X0973]